MGLWPAACAALLAAHADAGVRDGPSKASAKRRGDGSRTRRDDGDRKQERDDGDRKRDSDSDDGDRKRDRDSRDGDRKRDRDSDDGDRDRDGLASRDDAASADSADATDAAAKKPTFTALALARGAAARAQHSAVWAATARVAPRTWRHNGARGGRDAVPPGGDAARERLARAVATLELLEAHCVEHRVPGPHAPPAELEDDDDGGDERGADGDDASVAASKTSRDGGRGGDDKRGGAASDSDDDRRGERTSSLARFAHDDAEAKR